MECFCAFRVGYSTSCKQLRRNSPVRTDGEFNLLVNSKLVQVNYSIQVCHSSVQQDCTWKLHLTLMYKVEVLTHNLIKKKMI